MEAILYTISVDGGVGSSRDLRRRLHTSTFVPRQPRSRQLAATSSRSTLAPPKGREGRTRKAEAGQPARRPLHGSAGLPPEAPGAP